MGRFQNKGIGPVQLDYFIVVDASHKWPQSTSPAKRRAAVWWLKRFFTKRNTQDLYKSTETLYIYIQYMLSRCHLNKVTKRPGKRSLYIYIYILFLHLNIVISFRGCKQQCIYIIYVT